MTQKNEDLKAMDKASLTAYAASNGIEVDPRLSEAKLRTAVAVAYAAKSKSIKAEVAAEDVDEKGPDQPPPESAKVKDPVKYPAPKAIKYRVIGEGRYTVSGSQISYFLAKNSIVTSRTHDIKSIRDQGIPLSRIEEGE